MNLHVHYHSLMICFVRCPTTIYENEQEYKSPCQTFLTNISKYNQVCLDIHPDSNYATRTCVMGLCVVFFFAESASSLFSCKNLDFFFRKIVSVQMLSYLFTQLPYVSLPNYDNCHKYPLPKYITLSCGLRWCYWMPVKLYINNG